MAKIYHDGTYLDKNPAWHTADSQWKAVQIDKLFKKNKLACETIAEIGCGAGEILVQLSHRLPATIAFTGFDIAPAVIALAQQRASDRIHFSNADLLVLDKAYDLLLIIDVAEHVPDYMGFLEGCRSKARWKIFHIPLDLNVGSVLRGTFQRGRASLGHLHYFSAESALDTLHDTGYRVIDYAFTPGGLEVAGAKGWTLRRRFANVFRWTLAKFSTRLASRIFGGFSLLVLAE